MLVLAGEILNFNYGLLVALDDWHDGKFNLHFSTNKEFLFIVYTIFVLLFHLFNTITCCNQLSTILCLCHHHGKTLHTCIGVF